MLKFPSELPKWVRHYRNEITMGNFTFRVAEFDQMEFEYFVKPDELGERFLRCGRRNVGIYALFSGN